MNHTRICLFLLAFAALGTFAAAQQRVELRALTGNNTSASDRFHGQPNGNAAPANISKLPLRSLLYPSATARIASTYYSETNFSFDINLTDGQTHQVLQIRVSGG